jgi:Zn-dependent protease with chaperone function
MYRKVDTRTIRGSTEDICESVKRFVHNNNLEIKSENQSGKEIVVVAENKKKSFLALLFSRLPQIAQFKIFQNPDKQVQLEVSVDEFTKFRILYYSCICSLIIGYTILFKTSLYLNSIENESHILKDSLMGLGAFTLLLSVLFIFKYVDTSGTSGFTDNMYKYIKDKGYSYEAILYSGGYPKDITITVLIFLLSTIILVGKSVHFEYHWAMLGIIMPIVGFLALAFILYKKNKFLFKFSPCTLSIPVCLLLFIYGNIPLFNGAIMRFPALDNKLYFDNSNIPIAYIQKGEVQTYYYNYFQTPIDLTRTHIILLCSWIVFLFLALLMLNSAIRTPKKLIEELEKFYSMHKESIYYQALESKHTSMVANVITFCYWLSMSLFLVIGVFWSASILVTAVSNYYFPFSRNIILLFFINTSYLLVTNFKNIYSIDYMLFMHKIGLIIYSIPMLFLLCLIIRKNLISFVKGVSILRGKSKIYNDMDSKVYERVNRICLFANIRTPVVRIINSPYINAQTKYLGFPTFKNALVITSGALDSLNNKGELEFILAHEIWHIKRHNFKLKALCTFSDYTLFGNGFLSVLQNSFKIEQDADDFAIKWLLKNNMEKDAFKTLIEKQEEKELVLKISRKTSNMQNALSFASLRDDTNRRRLLAVHNEASALGKLWIDLKLLYQIYFGEEILVYFHPLNSQRIARIQNM